MNEMANDMRSFVSRLIERQLKNNSLHWVECELDRNSWYYSVIKSHDVFGQLLKVSVHTNDAGGILGVKITRADGTSVEIDTPVLKSIETNSYEIKGLCEIRYTESDKFNEFLSVLDAMLEDVR
jgi:hypothetical protein